MDQRFLPPSHALPHAHPHALNVHSQLTLRVHSQTSHIFHIYRKYVVFSYFVPYYVTTLNNLHNFKISYQNYLLFDGCLCPGRWFP